MNISWDKYLELKEYLFTIQQNKCYYCGIEGNFLDFHLDHYLPKSKGGKSKKENYVVACCKCNCSKGGKLISEWLVSCKKVRDEMLQEFKYREAIINKLENKL